MRYRKDYVWQAKTQLVAAQAITSGDIQISFATSDRYSRDTVLPDYYRGMAL